MRTIKDSHLADEFEGWDEDFIYEFDDGSKWKLASYTYSYSYSYRPRAKLKTDGFRYFLEVEGMGEPVEVEEVK
ncbi:hypothetical protein [Pantoea ananatis]|uniref:hypothetical protein n=1 Tax=Pantoea ananas TaxID=553 RepID=UPI000CF452C6|nr:hypothetical protein [Pantoea ananatis]PQK76481.1 hypothetical protein CG427_06960 [Pantoea ananatis]